MLYGCRDVVLSNKAKTREGSPFRGSDGKRLQSRKSKEKITLNLDQLTVCFIGGTVGCLWSEDVRTQVLIWRKTNHKYLGTHIK